ncbi:MAG: tetratricopeptide repeat protein [Myxococcota bacterium]
MSRGARRRLVGEGDESAPSLPQPQLLLLALASGVPALVYQLVWSREVALLLGGQLEALSCVVVTFFGGLALGAWRLGALADRSPSPLRMYAYLEAGAALWALLSLPLLRGLDGWLPPAASPLAQLAVVGAAVLPATALLGGTLPALLRAFARGPEDGARATGWLVGANTLGAVLGVGLGVVSIPSLGLSHTLAAAAAGALTLGGAALWLSARADALEAPRSNSESPRGSDVPASLLCAAGLAGVVTLGFEVTAVRMATLQLGSSLYAVSAVLAIFLLGLGLGNLALAQHAQRTRHPMLALGWAEAIASASLLAGLYLLAPAPIQPAAGLSAATLLAVCAATLPATVAMGAAFPLLVRVGMGTRRVAGDFGVVSAANTAGGIAGALLVPFFVLPRIGVVGSAGACAALAALLAGFFLWRGSRKLGRAGLRSALAAGIVSLSALPLWLRENSAPLPSHPTRLLYVAHGAQASTVVRHVGRGRELFVDGDIEAASFGPALRTERLIAVLPLLVHPDPKTLLEIGLGSGISLGTAARFPLTRIDCVEIAQSVLDAARYFAPTNGAVATGQDERLQIRRASARAFLARHPERYDVVLANTLHPWSAGATGLYSVEYFERMRGALRPGGIAAQWLPVERISASSLGAILRTFFAVFEHGSLWWGEGNLLVLGSPTALPALDAERVAQRLERAKLRLPELGIRDLSELRVRRIANAASVREVLGDAEILRDDLPRLELEGARARNLRAHDPLQLVAEIANTAAGHDPKRNPITRWLQSRVALARGEEVLAAELEAALFAEGFGPAREARVTRRLARAQRQFANSEPGAAAATLRETIAEAPEARDPRFALAALRLEGGDTESAARELRELLEQHPEDAEAWNLLGAVESRAGRLRAAAKALDHALRVDPFLPQALANAGLVALLRGQRDVAQRMQARLRALAPLGPHPEELALQSAIEDTFGR